MNVITWSFFAWISISFGSTDASQMSDIHLKTPDLIVKYGYPAESHKVVTEDGYILTLHRIPYSSKSPAAANKSVAFLQHGVLGTSADWIVLGPNTSIAYLLADAGYDVWMGNSRGNTYSRKHKTLASTDEKFWDYSFHEMGLYDLSAEIDYIVNITKQQSLYCMAVSLGNAEFFTLLSVRPEYNDKIRILAAAAPFVLLNENSGTIISATPTLILGQILHNLGFRVLAPYEWPQILLAQTVCANRVTSFLCSMMIYEFSGYDIGELNENMLPTIVSHQSGGVALKIYKHVSQNLKSGKFQNFDYGSLNDVMYKQDKPPAYNLNAIIAPVALYYGMGDTIVLPKDVLWLNETLGNCVSLNRIPRNTFSHFGFLYGKHVKYLVNDRILELFKLY